MNHSDEELQGRIENGEATGDSADARAYRLVFDALRQEPFAVNAEFADRVIMRIDVSAESVSRDYFWIGLGIMVFVMAAILSVFLTGNGPDSGLLKFFSANAAWGILIVGILLIIQITDKQLIRKKVAL
jgi:hypothetical protein